MPRIRKARKARKAKKVRTQIPADIAAKVLFLSNRTCCVCRTPGKLIQIHHIDEDPSNHEPGNLCVLCADCHNLTMVKGGFHRLLGAEQIVLYRDDWARLVAQSRSRIDLTRQSSDEGYWVELVTAEAEILRENQQFELLAQHYDMVGNTELRDKYIKRALARRPKISPISEIQLRKMQGKLSLVKRDRIRAAVKALSDPEQLSQLARLYVDLGQWEQAIGAYCEDIAKMVKNGDLFSAAYYAKEFAEEKLYNRLFESELRSREKAGDLWWQIRCLRELGWDTELEALMKAKRSEIEASGDYLLLSEMYEALGEDDKYVEVQKKITEGTQLVDFGSGPIVGIARKEKP